MNNIIKFVGENCQACKILSKYLKEKYPTVSITEYNIDSSEGMTMAEKYGIMSVPVMIKLSENEDDEFRINGFIKRKVDEMLFDEVNK